jgi:hypothetical protein
MSYPSIWFKGMDEKEKESFVNSLKTSPLVPKLQEILLAWVNEAQKVTQKDYDNPAWAYRQAHDNGIVQAHNSVLKLFDPKEK